MRTCVMHLLTGFEVGGAEVVALNLARCMDRSMFRVMACSLSGPGPMESRFAAHGIETRYLTRRRTVLGKDLGMPWRLARLLRRERVDLLHCHNRLPLLAGAIAAKPAGVKAVICTRHAIGMRRKRGQPWFLERLVAPLVSHYVTVSRGVLERAVSTGRIRADKATVIHNGVDTERYVPAATGARDATSPVVLGCVARLSDEKRHCDLIDALGELVNRGHDVRLDLVGDGTLRDALTSQVSRLGLGERVAFLGSRDDVPELLHRLDLFVLPSRFEGLPLTVLEAMATGLPVVATRVGSLDEVVEEGRNGLLVPAEDPAALADALEKLVTDADLRERMGREGRTLAESTFSLSAAARRHEELYLRTLSKCGATPRGERT